jgi:hypothetical protein
MRLPLVLLFVTACAPAEDYGIDGPISATEPGGKEDNAGRPGPLIATNTTATQVWTASNKWEDTNTPAAQKAGIAWPAQSGLNWNEKFNRWIESMAIVTSADGYDTYTLTTPWGKTLPSPVLECAESQMFLRASFAAWYNLPFMLETVGAGGARVYFGHFGIRSSSGKYQNTPNFGMAYKDYTSMTAAQIAASWPRDATLRTKVAEGDSDAQAPIGEAHIGAYLDEVHLNKRAGYFIVYLLNFLGSSNLADTANTYNLRPEAIMAGDLLLHRWQKTGIGDAKMLKHVEQSAGVYRVRLMSGSMPRRQAKIYDENASKSFFQEDDTGGPGNDYDGDSYYSLGGGVKRWRVTKNIGGRWTNTWMAADEANWIDSTNVGAITGRPARFGELLEEVPPEKKRDALLAQIEDARAHLLQYPASCSARDHREQAFTQLYALAGALGTTQAELDQQYRRLEDYVFASLVYTHAKTCCWDSTTAAMGSIVMDYASKEQAGVCKMPTVFRAESGGYARWSAHAATLGQAAAWKAWNEDETCPQRDTVDDLVAASTAGDWCSLDSTNTSPSCTPDAYEPNDTTAHAISLGTLSGSICAGDEDRFSLTIGAGRSLTVKLDFVDANGDLDLVVVGPSGTQVGISEGTSNEELVSLSNLTAGTYMIRVYGYDGATNNYTLTTSVQ